jgi:hypothetical protein
MATSETCTVAAMSAGWCYDVTIMATRTQIYLPPDEHRRARLKAAEQGISLTEYVRRLIHSDLQDTSLPRAHISEVFGIGDSGGSNVGRYKDQYLGEAVEKHWRDRVRR